MLNGDGGDGEGEVNDYLLSGAVIWVRVALPVGAADAHGHDGALLERRPLEGSDPSPVVVGRFGI